RVRLVLGGARRQRTGGKFQGRSRKRRLQAGLGTRLAVDEAIDRGSQLRIGIIARKTEQRERGPGEGLGIERLGERVESCGKLWLVLAAGRGQPLEAIRELGQA